MYSMDSVLFNRKNQGSNPEYITYYQVMMCYPEMWHKHAVVPPGYEAAFTLYRGNKSLVANTTRLHFQE